VLAGSALGHIHCFAIDAAGAVAPGAPAELPEMWRITDAHAGPVWDLSTSGVLLASVGGDGELHEWVLDCSPPSSPAGPRGAEPAPAPVPAPHTPRRSLSLTAVVATAFSRSFAQDVAGAALRLGGSDGGGADEDGPGGAVSARSVCWLAGDEGGGGGLCVGTATGEVYHVRPDRSVALVQSAHAARRAGGCAAAGCEGVLGLAAHPREARFATAGDDGSVRLWDAHHRRMELARLHFET